MINDYFDSVEKSMALFQEDELFSKPGNSLLFFYSKSTLKWCFILSSRNKVPVYHTWMDSGQCHCGESCKETIPPVHEILFPWYGPKKYVPGWKQALDLQPSQVSLKFVSKTAIFKSSLKIDWYIYILLDITSGMKRGA